MPSNASEEDPIFRRSSRPIDSTTVRQDLQTFVFSATLSKDLQTNLKRGFKRKPKKGGVTGTTLDDLVERLDFRDPKPELIDLSPEGGLVSTLRESIVECLTSEKVREVDDSRMCCNCPDSPPEHSS